MGRVRALLFDIDGTLSDSDDRMVADLQSYLRHLPGMGNEQKRHDLARSLVRAIETPGNFVLEMADRLGLDGLIARVLDHRARLSELVVERFPIIAGVPSMLEALRGRYPMAVVSARNEVSSRQFLQLNGLEERFELLVTSQTCRLTKPFAEPLLYAASHLNVPIENCLMIGDTVTDVRAARAAGAQSLSVLCGFGTERELRRSGTHWILESTALLAGLLKAED